MFTEGIVLSQASLNRWDAQSKVERCRVAVGKRGSQPQSMFDKHAEYHMDFYAFLEAEVVWYITGTSVQTMMRKAYV